MIISLGFHSSIRLSAPMTSSPRPSLRLSSLLHGKHHHSSHFQCPFTCAALDPDLATRTSLQEEIPYGWDGNEFLGSRGGAGKADIRRRFLSSLGYGEIERMPRGDGAANRSSRRRCRRCTWCFSERTDDKSLEELRKDSLKA